MDSFHDFRSGEGVATAQPSRCLLVLGKFTLFLMVVNLADEKAGEKSWQEALKATL